MTIGYHADTPRRRRTTMNDTPMCCKTTRMAWSPDAESPAGANALSQGMLRALLAALADIAANPDARVVVLAGAGPALRRP